MPLPHPAPARIRHLLGVLGVLLAAAGVQAADPVVAGASRVDATFQNLGVRWTISGDDDADSTFLLEFREQGTATWRSAAPPMRARPGLIVDGAPLGTNYWAASAMFLEPGKTYDLRLTLWDPDGGGETRTLSGTTRVEPRPSPAGRTLYVVPGAGGGSGSPGSPFQGLQAAANAAQPGDTFHVAAGTYAAFQIATSGSPGQPISFLGPGSGLAVVDGSGTTRGVVTVGTDSSAPVSHVALEGLVIQNGTWGFDAQHSSEISIRYNTIRDVDFGVINRRDSDLERNQTVCHNVIEGRTAWPGAGIPSARGIDLRGHGNVVCHNRVRNFGDCVSVQPLSGPSYGNDVFGNDLAFCVDDGIEIDYNESNVRVWRNRVYNARMGVSVQPISGGPAYVLRNELFNLEDKPLKLHNSPVGLVIVHNTGVRNENAFFDAGSSIWRNALLRNNLFLGTDYAFEFVTVATDGFRDLDYDAWGTTRAGTAGEPHFKWDGVRYDDLADLQAGTVGVEDHGVAAAFGDLVLPTLPPSWDVAVDPDSRDLRLASGAPEIDAGAVLPNLNDAFGIVGAPDMGAFESGAPPPSYGPQALGAIFTDGFETGNVAMWSASAP
jgi:hypothetical protein